MLHTFWMRNFKLDPSSGRLCIVLINVKLLLVTERCEYDILHIMSFMVCLKRLYREALSKAVYMNERQLL